ncbi:adenylate/guanylate cyclase domain-containing protein [Ruegeria sediminis]|uniref:Adenylate/guanylate cyclase domain-containing protein n=1 Tax=Ruegeria sediminis TaxID=2583820 RepID=A0ABY2WSU0_9RHOB|nr:adenylate/guanylate cyclase domain-containing protein [Ruegeria sediminis]TMV03764.1 adenylate/guanylate cyclase domain-containing protein [Ruegeria sediminis]
MTTSHANPQENGSLVHWLLKQGLEGAEQQEILEGYCVRLVEAGVPLVRFHAAQSAFHPTYGGTGYSWYRDQDSEHENYEHRDVPQEQWLASPLYELLRTGSSELREKLVDQNESSRFPLLNELREKGATDYVAMAVVLEKLTPGAPIDPENVPEGVLLSWTTDHTGGFEDSHLSFIRSGLPYLGLALKSAANRKMAQDLLRVYLGRDAGHRVLSGEIRRGSLQKIDAVIWNFDLQDFTSLSERIPGPEIIAMLNDYLAVAVDVVESCGGNILKFMGDGLMAMFDVGEIEEDVQAALQAVTILQRRMAEKSAERETAGLPAANYTLALHAGEILYGNIGAESRLDFTVIGPAVNQTARIAGMHRALDQRILISDDVARAAGSGGQDLVSLGRYMLRGVPEPKELFTLYSPSG